MVAQIDAKEILRRNIEEWGERKTYHATLEEIKILIKGKASIVHLNKNNGDGTFSNKVCLKNKFFISSTEEKY